MEKVKAKLSKRIGGYRVDEHNVFGGERVDEHQAVKVCKSLTYPNDQSRSLLVAILFSCQVVPEK